MDTVKSRRRRARLPASKTADAAEMDRSRKNMKQASSEGDNGTGLISDSEKACSFYIRIWDRETVICRNYMIDGNGWESFYPPAGRILPTGKDDTSDATKTTKCTKITGKKFNKIHKIAER